MKNILLTLFFLLMLTTKNAFSVSLMIQELQVLEADLYLFVLISDDNVVGSLQLSDRAKESGAPTGSVGGISTESSAKMRRVMTYSREEKVDLEKLLQAIANKETSYDGLDLSLLVNLPGQRLTLFSRDARIYLSRLNLRVAAATPSYRLKDLLIATSYVYKNTPDDEKPLVIKEFCKGDYKVATHRAIEYVVNNSSEQQLHDFTSQHGAFLQACAPQTPVCPMKASPAGTQEPGTPLTTAPAEPPPLPSERNLSFELKGYVDAIERAKRLQEIYPAEFIPNYFIYVLEAPEEAKMDLVSLAMICKDHMPEFLKPDTDYPSWSEVGSLGTLSKRELRHLCEWAHATFTNPHRFFRPAWEMDQGVRKERQSFEQWIGELRKKKWGSEHSEFLRRVAQAAGGGSLKQQAATQSMKDRMARLWGGLQSAASAVWDWIKKDRSLKARASAIKP